MFNVEPWCECVSVSVSVFVCLPLPLIGSNGDRIMNYKISIVQLFQVIIPTKTIVFTKTITSIPFDDIK